MPTTSAVLINPAISTERTAATRARYRCCAWSATSPASTGTSATGIPSNRAPLPIPVVSIATTAATTSETASPRIRMRRRFLRGCSSGPIPDAAKVSCSAARGRTNVSPMPLMPLTEPGVAHTGQVRPPISARHAPRQSQRMTLSITTDRDESPTVPSRVAVRQAGIPQFRGLSPRISGDKGRHVR